MNVCGVAGCVAGPVYGCLYQHLWSPLTSALLVPASQTLSPEQEAQAAAVLRLLVHHSTDTGQGIHGFM